MSRRWTKAKLEPVYGLSRYEVVGVDFTGDVAMEDVHGTVFKKPASDVEKCVGEEISNTTGKTHEPINVDKEQESFVEEPVGEQSIVKEPASVSPARLETISKGPVTRGGRVSRRSAHLSDFVECIVINKVLIESQKYKKCINFIW